MTLNGLVQIVFYFIVLLGLAKPLGGTWPGCMKVGLRRGPDLFSGRTPYLSPLQRFVTADEMDWKTYGIAMLLFNAAGLLTLYVLQRVQGLLPLNPAALRLVGRRTWPSIRLPVSRPTRTGKPMEAKRRSVTSRKCWV